MPTQRLDRSRILVTDDHGRERGVVERPRDIDLTFYPARTRSLWRETALPVLTAKELPDFKLGKKSLTLEPPKAVLLLEAAHTMYMPTPSLGVDKVANLCRRNLPKEVPVYTAIINYETRDKISSIRLHELTAEGAKELPAQKGLASLIQSLNPNLIGIGGTSKEFGVICQLLQTNASLLNALVFAGGVHASIGPENALQRYGGRPLDVVFSGRAHESIPQFLRLLSDGKPEGITSIPHSLSYGMAGEREVLVKGAGPHTPVIKTRFTGSTPLNFSLPESADQRLTMWGDRLVVRVQSAEGCQFSCSFCGVSALTLQDPMAARGQRWIPYDLTALKKFLDSIERDKRVISFDPSKVLIYLEDAQIGGLQGSDHDRRASDLLKLLGSYPYRFGIQTRYDTFIRGTPEGREIRHDFIDLLSKGHVEYLFTSVESIDRTVLHRMSKGQAGDPHEIYRVYKALRERGIDSITSCIGGTEGEPAGAATRTAAFIAEVLNPAYIAFEIAKVYPGTKDATIFAAKHGVDVTDAYTTGRTLTPYDLRELPPEERGTVLQATSLASAIRLHETASNMILYRGKLRERFGQDFEPLSYGKYSEVQAGFFARVVSPIS